MLLKTYVDVGLYLHYYHYYYYYFTKRKQFKNYEKRFLLRLKSSFNSRDSHFSVFFVFLSTVSRFKKSDETGHKN